MIFEWDDNKNRINKQKHGVSFETASRIFLDPFLIVTEDTAHNEVRWLGVGSVDGVVRYLSYTRTPKQTAPKLFALFQHAN